jgi:hypothetical protein
MADRIKVFFLTPTNEHEQKLRRICSKEGCGCYMTATFIGRVTSHEGVDLTELLIRRR